MRSGMATATPIPKMSPRSAFRIEPPDAYTGTRRETVSLERPDDSEKIYPDFGPPGKQIDRNSYESAQRSRQGRRASTKGREKLSGLDEPRAPGRGLVSPKRQCVYCSIGT